MEHSPSLVSPLLPLPLASFPVSHIFHNALLAAASAAGGFAFLQLGGPILPVPGNGVGPCALPFQKFSPSFFKRDPLSPPPPLRFFLVAPRTAFYR